ncbi:MAG: peptidase M48 [Betaproteobacteria bacterium RBG_16_56_24]|nr:MAG: peptidase M48 [Betaproteobacteria bacterium RBG_16_56_24]
MYIRTLFFSGLCLLFSFPARAFDFDLNKALSIAKKAQQATQTIDEPEEINIGDGIAANLLGASPLLADVKAQQYVNHVGRWLSLQTERPDLPWKFGILKTTDINAFATPGGTIFITHGLLKELNNESELAGVLAHEMVHVLRKHHLAALQKGARMDIASGLAGEALKDKGNPAVMDKAIKAGTEVYARGLDKNDEFEADRMGIVIATRAGYDPYGLPAVLQMLEAGNAQDSSLALMFKTHPAPRDRLSLLDKIMGDGFDAYTAPSQTDQRFNSEISQRK